MARLFTAAFLLITASVIQCKKSNDFQLESLKSTNNEMFAIGIFSNISRHEKNVFFSPLSVSTLMSQVYLGTRGETQKQVGLLGYIVLEAFKVNIHKTYHRLFNQLKSTSEYKLEIANALLIQADFHILQQYRSTLERYYDTIVKEVDFVRDNGQAVQEVNSWVSEKTHGKIPSLVDSLDESTRLVLLNAVYFKGIWQTQFEPEMTERLPFYNNGGENAATVPMMRITTRFPFLDDDDKHVKVLQLPYKGNDMSMLLVLPYERDGLAKLKEQMAADTITEFLENLDTTRVIVSIPKFKLEFSRKLKEDFKNAGVTDLFDDHADLSGINGKRDLYVSEIIHKAKIEVNEEGSEAAAVTGGFISNRIMPNPDFIINEFNADHPFLFYIIHNKSKFVLFVGTVDEL